MKRGHKTPRQSKVADWFRKRMEGPPDETCANCGKLRSRHYVVSMSGPVGECEVKLYSPPRCPGALTRFAALLALLCSCIGGRFALGDAVTVDAGDVVDAFELEHEFSDAQQKSPDSAADSNESADTSPAADVVDAHEVLVDAAADVEQLAHDAGAAADVVDAHEVLVDAPAADAHEVLVDAAADVGGPVMCNTSDPPAGCACSPTMGPPLCASPYPVSCAPSGGSLEGECCNEACL